MSLPRATYRLQLHKGFTFADAARVVPYLAKLGVSHLYASPIMTARAGSMHGYDVIDPTRVNSELGGEEGFRALAAAARRAGLGLIVDIVPNHMAVGNGNAWWRDVLAHGRASRYAHYFDIDWEGADPRLRGKVLLPVLGRPYGEALGAREIAIARDARGDLVVKYFDNVFPVAPSDYPQIAAGPDDYESSNEQGRARLHGLLERQHYRLAYWRTAGDEINWRRFFDINELAALRQEDDDVFEATHATLFRLYAEGLIDGLRIDHVDGLANPAAYCRKLYGRLAQLAAQRPHPTNEPAYLVVEKILGANESPPSDWNVHGTTGYDFMDQVAALLHEPAGEAPLNSLWQEVSGRPGRFEAEEEWSRREILDRSFSAQREAAAAAFHEVAQGALETRDVTLASLRRVVTELLAYFPVYRVYTQPGRCSEADRTVLATTAAAATRTALPGDRPIVELIAAWLRGEPSPDERRQARALTRFQQLSAPVAAKAVEDTAFYRYGRLLSRNDVGFEPARFADSPEAFHRKARQRGDTFPHAMLATATHDHKRGEDVRARLAVLSEMPDAWAAALRRWLSATGGVRRTDYGDFAPTDRFTTILLQTIVGAWPLRAGMDDRETLRGFRERLNAWQEKALREAKLTTDWATPDEKYEQAARDFLIYLFDEPAARALLDEIAAFAHRLGPAGAVNGLAQVLLKLTAPGVPDIYQGTEFWDLSLVDPDNRRPVDFAAREAALGSVPAEALASWRDGRVKQAVVARTLALRRSAPELFSQGEYVPLPVTGPRGEQMVAFARRAGGKFAVVVCPLRCSSLLLTDDTLRFAEDKWEGARLGVGALGITGPARHVFTAKEHHLDAALDLATLWRDFPVGLLTNVA
jgi:(1->4)-alpha-D-glucan 1-alpha-D-glucosylmutase